MRTRLGLKVGFKELRLEPKFLNYRLSIDKRGWKTYCQARILSRRVPKFYIFGNVLLFTIKFTIVRENVVKKEMSIEVKYPNEDKPTSLWLSSSIDIEFCLERTGVLVRDPSLDLGLLNTNILSLLGLFDFTKIWDGISYFKILCSIILHLLHYTHFYST